MADSLLLILILIYEITQRGCMDHDVMLPADQGPYMNKPAILCFSRVG